MAQETIYALSTPPGRGAVAVIRVSGAHAIEGLRALLHDRAPPDPRRAATRTLFHPVSRETLDCALILVFAGPSSFTGEDSVEYHLHGGPAVVASVLDALAHCPGHRMAEPGEFTRRAFENDKLDLTAAEAIADLVNAQTQLQKAQALSQMGGALARLYEGWADKLARTLAYMEANIDFAEEELPEDMLDTVRRDVCALGAEIAGHLQDNRRGEMLREGVHMAVIGAPNAGKSSLVNALARRDVAIVSEFAGTTRDIIEVHLDIAGFPVILADTAGLRPNQLGESGQDTIESEGIRRALQRAEQADIRLLVFDATRAPDFDPHTLALIDAESIVLVNKMDQADAQMQRAIVEDTRLHAGGRPPIPVSVAREEGLTILLERLKTHIGDKLGGREALTLTRARHRTALEEAHAHLTRAEAAGQIDMMAEDIRLATRALGRITGRVDVEDLLDIIFRDFCIGK